MYQYLGAHGQATTVQYVCVAAFGEDSFEDFPVFVLFGFYALDLPFLRPKRKGSLFNPMHVAEHPFHVPSSPAATILSGQRISEKRVHVLRLNVTENQQIASNFGLQATNPPQTFKRK